MAAVVFAIGTRPGLSAENADTLADLLSAGPTARNNVAIKLAGRIKQQVGLDPDEEETSEKLDLDQNELREIASVFGEAPDLLDEEQFAHLNRDVLTALSSYSLVQELNARVKHVR